MASQFDLRADGIVTNLVKLYRSASPADRAAGLDWYPAAHRTVCAWADLYAVPIATVACVIAAISPQVRWERNLEIAQHVLSGEPLSAGTSAYRTNLEKARRILEDRATSVAHYFKDAPKVTAFSRNLVSDDEAVTIDTHAFQAGLNDPCSRIAIQTPVYRTFERCYQRAAISVGIAPSAFQAVCWLAWRTRYPTIQKRNLRTQWSFCGELESEERF